MAIPSQDDPCPVPTPSPSQQRTLWTPSTPIVFADRPRTMRQDFTWKRGNDVVFGPIPAFTQKRAYAAKKPTPAKPYSPPASPRYQPRPLKTRSDVANPSDLSFLATPPARQPPKPYQPRVHRTMADPVNPNDLSFLEPAPELSSPAPPSPAISQHADPSPPSISDLPEAMQSSQALSLDQHASDEAEQEAAAQVRSAYEQVEQIGAEDGTSDLPLEDSHATSEHSVEDLVEGALAVSELASARKQSSGIWAQGPSLVNEFEEANRLLQDSLAAVQARARSQEQAHNRLRARLQREKETMMEERAAALAQRDQQEIELRDKLSQAETRNRRLDERVKQLVHEIRTEQLVTEMRNKNNSLQTVNAALTAANNNLRTTKKTLEKELEIERDPKFSQFKRLTRYQELKVDQDERERQQKQKERRAAQRATYTDFQDFFNLGSRDVRRWLLSDVKAQKGLERRSATYWKEAARKFESFMQESKDKDDFRFWDVEVTGRTQSSSAQAVADNVSALAESIKRRDVLFEKLAADLRARADESNTASAELEDTVWDFENEAWEHLKHRSHDARYYSRILRFGYDTMPGSSDYLQFNSARSAKLSVPLKDIHRTALRESKSAKRALLREKDPEKQAYWRRRRDALAATLDLVTVAREISQRHDDVIESEWLMQQPLANIALRSTMRPLMAIQTEIQARIDHGTAEFTARQLDPRQWFLKPHDLYASRKMLVDFEEIVYRNLVLAEKHGRLDDAQIANFSAFPLREYQESMAHLKVLLRAHRERHIDSWSHALSDSRRKKKSRDTELLEEPDVRTPLSLAVSRQPDLVENEPITVASQKSDTSAGTRKERSTIASQKSDTSDRARTVRSVKNDTVSKRADTVSGDEFASFDSPMDAFESPRSDEIAVDSSNISAAVSEVQPESRPDDGDTELFAVVGVEPAAPALESVSRPSYTTQTMRSRAAWDRSSATVEPHKGVLPKPDYGGRQRRRAIFKPTRSRRQAFQPQGSEVIERSWLAHEDQPFEHSDNASYSSNRDGLCFPNSPDASTGSLEPAATQTMPPKLDDGQTKPSSPVQARPESSGSTENGSLETAREVHTPLTYQIPEQELRNALLASKASGAAFWKHTLYRGPADEKIKIYYCTKYEQAEAAAKLFLNESVLGFDAEWESGSKIETSSIKELMSLIQIATEDRIALFQIASFYGDTAEGLMPPSLRILLESPKIVKAGVNISGDYTRLRKCFNIQGQGLFELSHLYKVVKYSESDPTKVDRKTARLADQVEDMLYLPLAKGAVRTSAWSKRLSAEQVEYAASDAYAGYRLYDAMEARRKAMVPTPPRPALYELQMPLILGDGKPAPRKKSASTRKASARPDEPVTAASDVPGSEEDKVGTAEEIVEEPQDDAEAATDSQEEFYSCEELQDTRLPGGTLRQTPAISTAQSNGPAVSDHSIPSELVAAEEWVTRWREESIRDRKPTATPASLRAYALWHLQSLSIRETAALLRKPPLSQFTVALYVLDAIKHEGLPFKLDRLREVLGFVPVAAQWRYTRLIEKVRKMEAGR